MFTRQFQLPNHSFFLFGPRGTGKTTWLRHVLPEALWFDLLRTQTFLALTYSYSLFVCGRGNVRDGGGLGDSCVSGVLRRTMNPIAGSHREAWHDEGRPAALGVF
jgi:hypothetical protein